MVSYSSNNGYQVVGYGSQSTDNYVTKSNYSGKGTCCEARKFNQPCTDCPG